MQAFASCNALHSTSIRSRISEKTWINDVIHWGIVTTKKLLPGNFIVEYRGQRRDEECEGEYVYEYSWKKKCYRIDATEDSDCLGRLINDNHLNPNANIKCIELHGIPHLCLFAVSTIEEGSEIRYNYGHNLPFPWRTRTSERDTSPNIIQASVVCDVTLNILQSTEGCDTLPNIRQASEGCDTLPSIHHATQDFDTLLNILQVADRCNTGPNILQASEGCDTLPNILQESDRCDTMPNIIQSAERCDAMPNILQSAEICDVVKGDMEKSTEMDNFMSVFDYNWDFLFYRSQVNIENHRESVLRKPQALPLEQDVTKLKSYALDRIQHLSDQYLHWGIHEFTEMRALLVCRLTLFNARRGGEPARLTLAEWNDASNDAWVDPQLIETVSDPLESVLLKTFKLAYQCGKGSRKQVPVLIPLDIISGIERLVSERNDIGVSSENKYLFAYTQKSMDHVLGWSCVKDVASVANLEQPRLITATKFRHRASTLYALHDIPENEHQIFFRHMGHSAEINKNVYQCPLAVKEITKVGSYLQSIDGNIMTGRPSAEMMDGPESNSSVSASTFSRGRPSAEMMDGPESSASASTVSRRRPSSEMMDNDAESSTSASTLSRQGTSMGEISEAASPVELEKSVHWSKQETTDLELFFKSFFKKESVDITIRNNKGNLPSKQQILQYLEEKTPSCLQHIANINKCYRKVRTKLFNQRKYKRQQASLHLSTI